MSGVSRPDAHSERGPILVSACLLGLPTRHDGGHCRRAAVLEMARQRQLIPVCPEQLGGLPTPREAAEIASGAGADVLDDRSRVVNRQGEDVTSHFLRGARTVADLAQLLGARQAVFKEGSPSCGVTRIRRNGQDLEGNGVTTALLKRKDIEIEGIE